VKVLCPETGATSQSVPRDGGYCNNQVPLCVGVVMRSQSVPRDGGYCNG